MIKVSVVKSIDLEYSIIDVGLMVNGEVSWIKGFDDFEWKEANEFALELSTTLGLGTAISGVSYD